MKKVSLILSAVMMTAMMLSSCGGGASTEVTIGTQVWTSKNLDVSAYRNGDAIPQVQDPKAWANLTTGAWCYYDNDASNDTKYGKLYNWYAVNDPRGLAPNGYHIPSDAEWAELSDYSGGTSEAGTKMKSTGTQYWQSPNTDATNESGFSGLPGGYRNYDGTFYDVGYGGDWWSSTEDGAGDAWSRDLNYFNGGVGRYDDGKGGGFSVRCLRD